MTTAHHQLSASTLATAVLALVAAVLVLSLPPSAATGRWLTSAPPSDHPALATVTASTTVQCGLRCLLDPLCVGIRPPDLPDTTGCTLVTCLADWHAFDGSCYRVFSASLRWQAAEEDCASAADGGHLVSISSSAEHDFVVSLALGAGEFLHIGLFLPPGAATGDRRWTDGSKVTFTAWYQSQPNEVSNTHVIGTNLMPDRKEWNDKIDVSASHPYICEYRLVGK